MCERKDVPLGTKITSKTTRGEETMVCEIAGAGCDLCALYGERDCSKYACMMYEREDKITVRFRRIKR